MITRIGQGYDLHQLVADRRLILGGIEIPFEMGLLGHSDADVVVHALIDALLGAAGLGDIGDMFPDTDPELKDADSCQMLSKVIGLLVENGFEPVNVDITIIAQRPKLSEYKQIIRQKLAHILGLDTGAVNIKAKTNEKQDAVGKGKAIICQAIAALKNI